MVEIAGMDGQARERNRYKPANGDTAGLCHRGYGEEFLASESYYLAEAGAVWGP